jgi:hypothetical protein
LGSTAQYTSQLTEAAIPGQKLGLLPSGEHASAGPLADADGEALSDGDASAEPDGLSVATADGAGVSVGASLGDGTALSGAWLAGAPEAEGADVTTAEAPG